MDTQEPQDTQDTGHGFIAVWFDEQSIPRAYGTAPDQPSAETQADIQRDEYESGITSRRWDVRLVTRETRECITDRDGSILCSFEVARVSR